jgi:glycosyltransferase involved in cell wall biosynthesis
VKFVTVPWYHAVDADPPAMSRAFLICPEPIARLTAGVGTRFLQFARLLVGAGHKVTIAVPNDPQESGVAIDGVCLVRAEVDRLGDLAEGNDWVLLHGHLGNHYLAQRDDLPVVVDLYDPFMIENFHYHRELGFEPYHTDHATWRLQMARGDLFLCSSQEQRLYYLGWLTALGRVHPLNVEDDPNLDRLIVELPFGTPEQEVAPAVDRAALFPDVDMDAPLLYFGGIYDWYDPLLVLEALPELLDFDPRTSIVFVQHPHPQLTPLAAAYRTREVAEQRGWLDRQVRFEEWRPFDRRFELPQVCDVAVVTHRPGLETDLSLRTRLVDLLWLGLPVVVTSGGTMSRVVREEGAGEVVPPGDPGALARAVRELISDEERARKAAAAGKRWAAGRGWEAVVAPLLDFAEHPWRDQNRSRLSGLDPGQVRAREPVWNRVCRVLRRLGGRR